jgi:inorganic pyrophosphatase
VSHVDLTDQLLAFVEIPKGGRNKYEYDEESGRIVLDRFLSSSMVYPADYGFLIGHRGLDGDPLDCLVCVSEATFPGCVIPVNPVAMFEMRDEAGIDDKIVCVPVSDPGWNSVTSLEELPEQLKLEIPHFFSVYKDLEHKEVEVGGWKSREEAEATIAQARELQIAYDAEKACG